MTIGPPDWRMILELSGLLCLAGGGWLAAVLILFPRAFLSRFPAEVQAAVPPLTHREKAVAWIVTIPFLLLLAGLPALAAWRTQAARNGEASPADLFIAACAVWQIFNLFDWLVLDELLIGVFRPRSLRLPGAERIEMRFDRRLHAVEFLKGCLNGAVYAALVAFLFTVL